MPGGPSVLMGTGIHALCQLFAPSALVILTLEAPPEQMGRPSSENTSLRKKETLVQERDLKRAGPAELVFEAYVEFGLAGDRLAPCE